MTSPEDLLDDPAALERIAAAVGDLPALIEPWNVSPVEQEVATRLGIPLNGTAPELEPLGYKSAGRRLLRESVCRSRWVVRTSGPPTTS